MDLEGGVHSNMTSRERLTKALLFFSILLYYMVGYFFVAQWTANRTDMHYIGMTFEKNIPLLPSLIFAYMLLFAFQAFAYLIIDELNFFKTLLKAFYLCVTIHFIIFMIFPVQNILRPVIDPDRGWAYFCVDFYYWLDPPYNCFPSMHVSNTFLISFFLSQYKPKLSWVLYSLATLVSISVVLVKQHYIADVVAGYLVAWAVYRWVYRAEKAPLSQMGAVRVD